MTLAELKKLIEELQLKDEEDVDKQIAEWSPITVDRVKVFGETDDGKKYLEEILTGRVQSDVDRKLTSAIEAHDKKSAPKIQKQIKEEAARLVNELNPKPDPVAIKQAEMQKQIDEMKIEGDRDKVRAAALTYAAQNSLDVKSVSMFFDRGDTLEDFKLFANGTIDMAGAKAKADVEKKLGDAAKPKDGGDKKDGLKTLNEIKAMTKDQVNAYMDEVGEEAIDKILSQ